MDEFGEYRINTAGIHLCALRAGRSQREEVGRWQSAERKARSSKDKSNQSINEHNSHAHPSNMRGTNENEKYIFTHIVVK